ncbi:MAG: formyltransferase family protein [Alphaproteobacteria bacterium]
MNRVAVVTSATSAVAGFVADRDLHRRIGVEVPLVVRTHPSMRLPDRLRDLAGSIDRRSRMTGRPRVAHLVEHFAWRAIHASAMRGVAHAELPPVDGQRRMDAVATDAPPVLAAVAEVRADLVVVFGGPPIPRASLEAIGVPMLNVHASDPSFCRGMPPVFWEVHAGLDSLVLTLHEIVARLDAGAVIAQRPVPIAWRRSLASTLRATRARMDEQVPLLLADGLAAMVAGDARPRTVAPGPLRTLPTLGQILVARRACGRRWRERG